LVFYLVFLTYYICSRNFETIAKSKNQILNTCDFFLFSFSKIRRNSDEKARVLFKETKKLKKKKKKRGYNLIVLRTIKEKGYGARPLVVQLGAIYGHSKCAKLEKLCMLHLLLLIFIFF